MEEKSTDMTQDEITFVVNNIGPTIQLLARQLNLDPTEMTEIERGKQSLKEKAQKILYWWIQTQGRRATKEAMVEALRHLKRNDMADELSEFSTDQDKLADFSKLQQRLMKRYSHYCIPQPPNIKKVLAIDDIFIHQEMEMRITHLKPKTEIVQITDLFKSDNDQCITRILVEGDPGFGKTTLVFKLANDWAKGTDYIASEFHLVMLIPLREIKEEQLEDVILGIIHRAVNRKCISRKDFMCYVAQHKVLLLLDGYDEMSTESRSYLKDILEKEELESACVLVTSRRGIFSNEEVFQPSMSLVLFQTTDNVGCEFWDKRIQLKGLTTEQRHKVINDNFDISPEAMKSMEELFSGNADEMFRCPLFVFWLGWLLEKKPFEQIGTRTAFYKALINLIFHKTMVRENIIKEKDSLDLFIPTKFGESLTLINQVQDFGKIALERLINQNLSFTEDDLAAFSSSLLIVSDLLVRYKSIAHKEEETHYQPMHKSFLEFLAAFSVSSSINNEDMSFDEFKTLITHLLKQGLRLSLDSLFFPFLAGLLEHRAYWLLQSLSHWSVIYNVCQPEIVNVLVEIPNPNEEFIQSLGKFIPPNYKIQCLRYNWKRYYSSEFHKRLFQMAVNRKLISVLEWDLTSLHSLPVESLVVERLCLKPSDDSLSNISSAESIHCDELICNIDKDVTAISWNFYLSVISRVNAAHYNLILDELNTSTCLIISNEILQGEWKHLSFQRICIPLENNHLELLLQLVKNNRIKKGVFLNLSIQYEVSASTLAMNQLWEAVIQSSSIDEFHFVCHNWQFNHNFDFSLLSDGIRKFPLQMMCLDGYFSAIHTEACCIESIKELMLIDQNSPNADLTNLLKTVRNVDYLECFQQLFSSCLSNNLPLASSLIELSLIILNNVALPTTADQLTSLRALTLNFTCLDSESIPQCIDDFLSAMLNCGNLRFLAFHNIPSANMFADLMNIMLKVKDLNLFCLELLFENEMVKTLSSSSLNLVKELLRKKQLNHVAIGDWSSSAPVRPILPVLFSEEEFQLKHEINGKEEQHSIRNRQWYKRLLVTNNRFIIKLKSEPDVGQ